MRLPTRPCPHCGQPLHLSNHHTYHCDNENRSVHRVLFDRVGRVLDVTLSSEPELEMAVHPRREAYR